MANQVIHSLISSLNSKFTIDSNWLSNSDLNNYKTNGFYMIGNNNAHQAYPWSFLIVIAPRSDSILQIQEAERAIAIRECRNDTWTEWKAVSMSS